MVLYPRATHGYKDEVVSPKFESGICTTNNVLSVGVKEGLGCVFSAPQWHGKSRNLALP